MVQGVGAELFNFHQVVFFQKRHQLFLACQLSFPVIAGLIMFFLFYIHMWQKYLYFPPNCPSSSFSFLLATDVTCAPLPATDSVLGVGAHGSVYKATHTMSGQLVTSQN